MFFLKLTVQQCEWSLTVTRDCLQNSSSTLTDLLPQGATETEHPGPLQNRRIRQTQEQKHLAFDQQASGSTVETTTGGRQLRRARHKQMGKTQGSQAPRAAQGADTLYRNNPSAE